jgi:hypothetical protein
VKAWMGRLILGKICEVARHDARLANSSWEENLARMLFRAQIVWKMMSSGALLRSLSLFVAD